MGKTNHLEVNEVYTLFEEIKGLIKKGSESKATIAQPEMKMPDFSEINELTDKLTETIEAARKPVKTEHHHIFSFESTKVLFASIGLSIICMCSLFTAYYLRKEISPYKDNDLKYRYVKMYGEVTPDGITWLEDVFDNKRDSIKILRKKVELHEKAVIEEAKRLERARLKEQEAERLRQEAEKLETEGIAFSNGQTKH